MQVEHGENHLCHHTSQMYSDAFECKNIQMKNGEYTSAISKQVTLTYGVEISHGSTVGINKNLVL